VEKVASDPLKNVPSDERKKLSDLMKTLKFTKKSDLTRYKDHEEVKMLFDFLEHSHIEDLKNLGKYLRLLQEHGDERQCTLFVEYYATHTD
jgi:hypothetical protein